MKNKTSLYVWSSDPLDELTFAPLTFFFLAFRSFLHASSMLLAILPLAFVLAAVWPDHLSLAFPFVIFVGTFIPALVRVEEMTILIDFHVIDPFSIVEAAV